MGTALCPAEAAGDPTGSRFKVIAHSFLTFPRVNYTEHGRRNRRNPEGSALVFTAASPPVPAGQGAASASLPRPLISLYIFLHFLSNLRLAPAGTPVHTHNLR